MDYDCKAVLCERREKGMGKPSPYGENTSPRPLRRRGDVNLRDLPIANRQVYLVPDALWNIAEQRGRTF